MSFPWKKSKMTRVSRLVSGFHKTPKRGGSLVVETGFPTSLIDLFVKNRDRLRRSSERKPDPTRPAGDTDARESASIARETDDDDDEKKKKNRIESEDELKMETELTRKQSTERTRSARIKSSLIKKFVPKKLRYRNGKNQGKSEKETHVKQEETESETESGTESETESETELKTELIIVPATKFDQNDQNLMTQSVKKEKDLGKGNSGHVIPFVVVVLVVVVLVGLIGGRGVALLLTLLCYSMISICVRTVQINADSDNSRKTK